MVEYKAKTATTDRWIYGRYDFVEGYHVIYEKDENGKESPPMIIKYITLEKLNQ
jgi:hypothetical protein